MFDRVLILTLDYFICFAVVLRGIHGKIDICQTYIRSKLRIFPYSEFTHGSATFKLKKKWSIIDFDVSVLCFIFFIPLFQTISVINKNGTYYLLHASKPWGMCWNVHAQSHTSNEEDCHWVTKEKKCFNLL